MAWKRATILYADLLKEVCENVFISCRPEQEKKLIVIYRPLQDTFTGLGPYGGILSAFRENPMQPGW